MQKIIYGFFEIIPVAIPAEILKGIPGGICEGIAEETFK